jgi:hypothetical protein
VTEWKPISTLPPATSALLRGPGVRVVLYVTDGKWPDPDYEAKGYTEWTEPTPQTTKLIGT